MDWNGVSGHGRLPADKLGAHAPIENAEHVGLAPTYGSEFSLTRFACNSLVADASRPPRDGIAPLAARRARGFGPGGAAQ